MKIVSIINLKGGVAKTTTAVSMAELLAEGDKRRGRTGSRVLLFDNDKQGNASRMFGVYSRNREAEACRILRTGHMESFSVRRFTGISGGRWMDIVPCNYFMELAELAVKADQERTQHDRYRTALREVAGQYDYCIIDNPSDLGMNVINAMTAADEIIIPVCLDAYSLDGLEEMVEQIDQIKALNPETVIAGVLITDYERSGTSEAAESWLRTKSGCHVFSQKIRHSKKAKEATFYRQTPMRYSAQSGAAQDYRAFVAEYVQGFGHSADWERG